MRHISLSLGPRLVWAPGLAGSQTQPAGWAGLRADDLAASTQHYNIRPHS